MANINIDNIAELDLNGNELFADSESFISELSNEQEDIFGGGEYVALDKGEKVHGDCLVWSCFWTGGADFKAG